MGIRTLRKKAQDKDEWEAIFRQDPNAREARIRGISGSTSFSLDGFHINFPPAICYQISEDNECTAMSSPLSSTVALQPVFGHKMQEFEIIYSHGRVKIFSIIGLVVSMSDY